MRESELPRSNVGIRSATRADDKKIVDLVIALAKFEHLEPPDTKARARLVRDIFDRKLVNVFVATVRGRIVGYALYFYTYSSFLAQPTLYLEDIFVDAESRHEGAGRALFMRCVKEASRRKCRRMEWAVLKWNRSAIEFYRKLGAKRVDDQRIYRLQNNMIHALQRHSSR